MPAPSIAIAITGSGGAGAMTAGELLLDAAAAHGWYGVMSRSFGPQIRGGEAAALLRLAPEPVEGPGDRFDLLLALDWGNIERFADEMPLADGETRGIVLADPAHGDVPEVIADQGPAVHRVPLSETARALRGGRANMVALGVLARLLGLPPALVREQVRARLADKGEAATETGLAALDRGWDLQPEDGASPELPGLAAPRAGDHARWRISGNEAAALGAVRGGIRFVGGYPITPATDILEWLAGHLPRLGGRLVQAEDELASINLCLGASYGGVPALTATSGPGLSLMMETLGLAVAAEIPVVVIDVMRGGPSTGIPTKSEQTDLDIAVHGLHGDAPHLVLAPTGIADCAYTVEWAVYLAEALQTPALVLSDQALGQARAVIDAPEDRPPPLQRRTAEPGGDTPYRRYALTEDGISPMALPGTPHGAHTADGLAHAEDATPSARASDHRAQLDKRARKLERFDFGEDWAVTEGDGPLAIVTWGSTVGPVREAIARAAAEGIECRLIAPRLIAPAQPERMAAALAGAERVLVVEQNHAGQLLHFLRAHYTLGVPVTGFHRPGPLPLRPGELAERMRELTERGAATVE